MNFYQSLCTTAAMVFPMRRQTEQIKTNNNTIRNLTGEYKKMSGLSRGSTGAVRAHERTLQRAE